jgi:D-aminopeptidase
VAVPACRRLWTALFAALLVSPAAGSDGARPRARQAGILIGILEPGPLNAITDVAGVAVGHRTIIEGDRIRTGVPG